MTSRLSEPQNRVKRRSRLPCFTSERRQAMIYFSPGSHISRFISFLALVGEYPTSSLDLLGSQRELSRLIDKLSVKQLIRNTATGESIERRILLIRGKGTSRTVRLSTFALPLLDWLGIRDSYISRFGAGSLSGNQLHIERNHRVAETAAMLLRAGIECRPWMLSELQLSERKLITDHTMAFFARDIKQIIAESLNKTKFARYTAALFMSGCCLPIYNTRNSAMKWYGEGERKVREDLTYVARANSACSAVDSAILLGRTYDVALATIQSTSCDRQGLSRFDRIYPRIFYVPFGDFGIRQLALFQVPSWREQLLSFFFDDDVRSYNKGAFEYDAAVDGRYVLSFLDGDIARLMRFRDAIRTYQVKSEVLCYSEQAPFLQEYLPVSVRLNPIDIGMAEEELGVKARDLLERS